MSAKLKSTNLDPEFTAELEHLAWTHDVEQNHLDKTKWYLAEKVNENWDEHKTLFSDKASYYVECSRVANAAGRKRFSDSGETLRRWCEVQATYANFDEAQNFLDALSFDHLARAKKLAKDGKVSVPVFALAKAVEMQYTADEMQYYFDPHTEATEYDRITSHLDFMQTKDAWKFLNSRENIEACISHTKSIREIVNAELATRHKAT